MATWVEAVHRAGERPPAPDRASLHLVLLLQEPGGRGGPASARVLLVQLLQLLGGCHIEEAAGLPGRLLEGVDGGHRVLDDGQPSGLLLGPLQSTACRPRLMSPVLTAP